MIKKQASKILLLLIVGCTEPPPETVDLQKSLRESSVLHIDKVDFESQNGSLNITKINECVYHEIISNTGLASLYFAHQNNVSLSDIKHINTSFFDCNKTHADRGLVVLVRLLHEEMMYKCDITGDVTFTLDYAPDGRRAFISFSKNNVPCRSYEAGEDGAFKELEIDALTLRFDAETRCSDLTGGSGFVRESYPSLREGALVCP